MLTALEALVEKKITGFPVIDEDWKLVILFKLLPRPLIVFFFYFPDDLYLDLEHIIFFFFLLAYEGFFVKFILDK